MKPSLLVVTLASAYQIPLSNKRQTHAINWDISDPMFEKQIPSKQVKLNDKLEIDCDKESTVYLVDSESFHSCQISNKIAFRCSGRRRERKILKIAEVSPSPNAILYQPNREYFFIGATSSQNLCSIHNLKLSLKVLPSFSLDSNLPQLITTAPEIEELPTIVISSKQSSQEQLLIGIIAGVAIISSILLIAGIIYVKKSKPSSSLCDLLLTSESGSGSSDGPDFNKSTYIDIQTPQHLVYDPFNYNNYDSRISQTLKNSYHPRPSLYGSKTILHVPERQPLQVGEPSRNALLSIAERVDPVYARELDRPRSRNNIAVNGSPKNLSNVSSPAKVSKTELSGYDTMDSDESNKKRVYKVERVGLEPSVSASSIEARLENGGMVISV